jgi:hypothetical protein
MNLLNKKQAKEKGIDLYAKPYQKNVEEEI